MNCVVKNFVANERGIRFPITKDRKHVFGPVRKSLWRDMSETSVDRIDCGWIIFIDPTEAPKVLQILKFLAFLQFKRKK